MYRVYFYMENALDTSFFLGIKSIMIRKVRAMQYA